jgi:hypothetical protein
MECSDGDADVSVNMMVVPIVSTLGKIAYTDSFIRNEP